MAYDDGYCDRCNNTGEVDCRCGGDLCFCGRGEIVCPVCQGDSAKPSIPGWEDCDDDYDYEVSDRAAI